MELKRCPFCGKELEEHPWKDDTFWHSFNLEEERCCFLEGKVVEVEDIEAWQTRADPWINLDDGPEEGWKKGEVILAKIYVDHGMGHGHMEYKELTMSDDGFVPPPEPGFPFRSIVAWQPITSPEET